MTDYIPVSADPLRLIPRGAGLRLGLYHDETTDEIHRIAGTSTVTATLGTPVDVAATAGATASVAASLAVNQAAAAVSTGVSTVAAHLDIDIAGQAHGGSSVTGDATVEALGGHLDGTSAVIGELTQHHALTAVTPGAATVTGQANQAGNSTALSAGVSTVTADLSKFGGTSSGTSTATGTLHGVQTLHATVAGKTSIVANTNMQLNAPGVSAGSSTVTGQLVGFGPGQIDGRSTVTGTLGYDLLGLGNLAPAGKSTVAATLTAFMRAGAGVSGIATVTVDLTVWGPGAVSGSSAVTGNLTLEYISLLAGATGRSTVYSDAVILHNDSAGQATVVGSLAADQTFDASVGGIGAVLAYLDLEGPFEVFTAYESQVAAAAVATHTAYAQVAKSATSSPPTPREGRCSRQDQDQSHKALDFV